MSGIKLLPCPFCGGENVIETYVSFLPVLQCDDCRATMMFPASFHGNYKKELAKKWNTRKPMERILTKLEEYRQSEVNFKEIIDTKREIANPTVSRTIGRIEAFDRVIEIVREVGD